MKDAAEMFLDPLTGLYHRAYFMDRFSEASESRKPVRWRSRCC